MKANEFRKGNLISFNGNISIILELSSNCMFRMLNDIGYVRKEYRDLSPIPLTEEWLVKFGFRKQTEEAKGIAVWEEFYIGNFSIGNHGIGLTPFVFHCDSGVTQLYYVHQLQNLYFALIGTELEFSPSHHP